MELFKLTIHELQGLLKNREVTSVDVTKSFLDRIKTVDKNINSYVTLTEDSAMKQAVEADKNFKKGGDLPPLLGIPLAIKDLICIEGVKTTCGSKMLQDFVSSYSATVITKLQKNGAIILGKLNMDEFAMGSSNENSYFGPTLNPWNLETVSGGSSGGSAAAAAADLCVASLGSDTGGSIRQPASFCGIVGLKPTYGRVSRFGLVAFASSLDQIGPMTKDVKDSAILMNIICGKDQFDSTSADIPVPDFTKSLVTNIKGMKIGIPKEFFIEGLNQEVESNIKEAIKVYKNSGAECIDISLPHTEYAVATYYILASAEASSNLARYDGIKYGYRADSGKGLMEMYRNTRNEGFGEEVKRRIMLGTYVLSAGDYDAYYLKAQKVRTLIKKDFDEAFNECDVIITPTTPYPAFKLGEKVEDPLQMYLSDIFTISANLSGIPSISIPCGFTRNGLPIGMQIMAKHFDEESIFRSAFTFQQNTDHHSKKPDLQYS